MISTAISKLLNREDLSSDEMSEIMHDIAKGQMTDAQITAFMIALRFKGETANEIEQSARALRNQRFYEELGDERYVDISGTGGDRLSTFNISTAAAFIAAGAGVKIAKHGTQRVSSKCGSADVINALGIPLDVEFNRMLECLKATGLGFFWSEKFNDSLSITQGLRQEIAARTIFNLITPLSNPLLIRHQVIGAYSEKMAGILAEVALHLGGIHVLTVNGKDGLDEISLMDESVIFEIKDGKIKRYVIHPKDFGLSMASLTDVRGGSIEKNRQMIVSVLSGRKDAATDIAVINAAAAIYAGDYSESLASGVEMAKDSVFNGKAKKKLLEVREYLTSL